MTRILTFLLLLFSLSAEGAEFSGLFAPRSPAEVAFRDARQLEAEKPDEAVARYWELLEGSFPVPDALHWALARLSPDDEAEAHWLAVVNAMPPSPFAGEAQRALASLYARQGKLGEAEATLRRLVDATPDKAGRAKLLAELLSILELAGKKDELVRTAKTLWTEYASLPESKRAAKFLTAAVPPAPTPGGAASAPVAPAPSPPSPIDGLTDDEALARGLALLNGGSREEAVKTLDLLRARLPAGSPLAGRVNLALGKALFFLRRYDQALAPLGVARGSVEQEEDARSYRAKVLFALNRGDEGAKELVQLALERPQSPNSPRYLEQASRVLEARRLAAEAQEAKGLLLKKYPRSAEARQARWFTAFAAYREGRYGEAAESFRLAGDGAERGWLRAESLYWEARSLLAGKEPERGKAVLASLVKDVPLGYYGRLGRALLEGRNGPLVGDARLKEPRVPPRLLPEAENPSVAVEGDALGRIQTYLRLGLPGAARTVLREVPAWDPRKAALAYWTEDFRGALQAARTTWLDWPDPALGTPDVFSREALAYPLAYPRTAWEAARKAGIHPHLLLAIAHTESHFDPRTYSVAEARGLMQFIPATAEAVAKAAGHASFSVEDLYKPSVALELGALHLRELLDRFSGDVVLAVAAYNAGATAVARWKESAPTADPELFVEAIPFSETRRYVKKVLTALDAYGRLDAPGLWLR